MTLERRTQRLEEEAGKGEESVVFMLELTCPVAESVGGGMKIKARSLSSDAPDEPPVRYYFEPEDGGEEEREELTKEEYDALLDARHTLPERDPRHKPRHEQ